MSHFTEVKTQLKNRRLILKALKNLKFQTEEAKSGVEVRGFMGDTQPADFKALTSSTYDIGFKQTESGDYELIADWELMPKVSDIEREDFLKDLKREYARAAILEVAEEKGFDVETVEDEETESIQMVVTQW